MERRAPLCQSFWTATWSLKEAALSSTGQKAKLGRTRSLNPQTGDLAETREIERRADEVVGFHVRRLAYAETLPYYSHLVRPTLFLRCTAWHRLIGGVMWPVTRRIMMQMYDIRPGAASESRTALESELDWIDAKLSDGRFYLAGDRFSRADLTVASLLAGFARPKEMSVYHRHAPMLSLLISSAGGRGLRCDGSLSSIGGTAFPAEKRRIGLFESRLAPPARGAQLFQQLRQLGEVHRHAPRLVARQPIWSPNGATRRFVRNRGRSGSARVALERR
jgi:glutathione S-transferase